MSIGTDHSNAIRSTILFLFKWNFIPRSFHRSSKLNASSYDGDGKMTVTILNKDHEYGLMIDAVETVSKFYNNMQSFTL